MEGMKDVKSDGSFGDETEKGVVFIDLPFMITMLLDLSALKVRPAHFRAIVQQESKFFVPQTVEDIIFRSSIKALIGGNKILFRWNCGVVAPKQYSKIMFIPAKKSIIDRVQPSKIPRWCLSQLLDASLEKDLLNIPECKDNPFMWDGSICISDIKPYCC